MGKGGGKVIQSIPGEAFQNKYTMAQHPNAGTDARATQTARRNHTQPALQIKLRSSYGCSNLGNTPCAHFAKNYPQPGERENAACSIRSLLNRCMEFLRVWFLPAFSIRRSYKINCPLPPVVASHCRLVSMALHSHQYSPIK